MFRIFVTEFDSVKFELQHYFIYFILKQLKKLYRASVCQKRNELSNNYLSNYLVYVMINNFFFSYNDSVRVSRAKISRIWPKHPTLHLQMAKTSWQKRPTFIQKGSITCRLQKAVFWRTVKITTRQYRRCCLIVDIHCQIRIDIFCLKI